MITQESILNIQFGSCFVPRGQPTLPVSDSPTAKGRAMRGLEQKVPPAPGVAMTPPSLLGYLSPNAQAWLPNSARSQLTTRLITGLRVGAALLCLAVLGQMLVSEPLAPYRAQILILLAGAATLIAIGVAEAVRQHNQVRAARESLGRLIHAADAGSIGFWGCDASGERFWATPTSLTILGLGDSPATLEQIVTQLHPGDQALFRDTLRRAADSGADSQCDCRQPRESGTAWLRFNIAVAPEARHQISGCVAEITEHHQLETEVTSVRNSLTHLTRVGLLGQLGGALAHE